jgi:PAS domain-containing protein
MKKIIRKKREALWLQITLPVIYLAAALAIDLHASGLLTPFFAVVGILFMALKYPPAVMIPWTVVYIGTVCAIYLSPHLFVLFSGHPYREPYFVLILRSATYLGVGFLASFLSLSLNRIKKSEHQLNQILENLPWPILTSDAYGRILYWNDAAETLLPSLALENGIRNYFDLLAPPEFYGRTISEYLKRMEQEHREEPLRLSVNGRPFKGYTQMIAWTDTNLLLTILSEGGNIPDRDAVMRVTGEKLKI